MSSASRLLCQLGSLPEAVSAPRTQAGIRTEVSNAITSQADCDGVRWCSWATRLFRSELELDSRDSPGRVEALRAGTRAVEDGVATVQAHLILELLLALFLVRVLNKGSPGSDYGVRCNTTHTRESAIQR